MNGLPLLTQTDNKEFWNIRAKDGSLTDKSVTNNDIFRRELEINSINFHLPLGGTIFEVGCGSGYGTKHFAASAKRIVATDYSPAMIELAKTNNPADNIEYKVEDILSPSNEAGIYDAVISQRCLINILNEKCQYLAISNLIGKLKSGGILFLLEGISDGRNTLNNYRDVYGLPQMPPVQFNLDFSVETLTKFIKKQCEIQHTIYHGTYDFISRVIYPSIINPEQPFYDAPINEKLCRSLIGTTDLNHCECSRTIFIIAKYAYK